MKRCLILLIIFSGLFNKVCGQSASAAIDSLIKYRVITPKQRPVLEKELLKYKGFASDRVAILGGLYIIILQKTFHIDPHKTGAYAVSYRFSDGYLNKKSRDSVNTALRLLLEKVNKAGLLTDRVYTHTLKSIDTGAYVAEVQMIGQLSEISSRLEWLAPDRLLLVAEELHKNGIVSDSSFLRLKDDIKNEKIESSFQLNDYCKLNRTFDLTKYGDDPGAWLERLHHEIASILPGLNFTNFNYSASPDSTSSFGVPGIKYKVSLTCNGHIYKYSRVAFTYGGKHGKAFIDELFAGSFYRIFNKVLADQQSPLRLHNIMFTPGKDAGDNIKRFALIALTAAQAQVFMKEPCSSFMMVSMDNYDNKLTSARVDSTIAGWRRNGLFAHLSEAEMTKAIDDAQADDWYSTDRLLFNFPGVVYSLTSSMESPHHPYVNLLTHLARITHGAFDPAKITQSKVNGGVKLRYLSKGKIHSYTFKTLYGWMDKKFPAFVKGLGQENNLPGSFYTLWYENAVIYLTKQQHDYAADHKLLDFGRN
jgi:hypothetical protein